MLLARRLNSVRYTYRTTSAVRARTRTWRVSSAVCGPHTRLFSQVEPRRRHLVLPCAHTTVVGVRGEGFSASLVDAYGTYRGTRTYVGTGDVI